MNRFARRSGGVIQKKIKPCHLAMDEARVLQCSLRGIKVAAMNHDGNILRVSYGGTVDRGDPRRHRVSTDNGIGHTGTLEGRRCTQQALTHLFHNIHHSLKQVGGNGKPGRHTTS